MVTNVKQLSPQVEKVAMTRWQVHPPMEYHWEHLGTDPGPQLLLEQMVCPPPPNQFCLEQVPLWLLVS